MKKKILVTSFYERRIVAPILKNLSNYAELHFCTEGRTLTQQELKRYLAYGWEIIIAAEEKYTAEVFSNFPSIQMIARDGVGLDSIDLEAATRSGVTIVNAPVVHNSVAELTIGLIIAGGRKIVSSCEAMRKGRWNKRDSFLAEDISGKNLGLIGFGRIGRAVARKAFCLDLRINAYDPNIDLIEAEKLGVKPITLEEILAQSDIVSLHLPLTEGTRCLINRKRIETMKPNSWIINTSRGEIINEADLIDALKSGTIAGAALDVLTNEPVVDTNNPLFFMHNVIVTPHVGSDTIDTFKNVYRSISDDINFFLRGERPKNLVNKELWDE